MPSKLLDTTIGIQKSTLDQITATAGNVQSGVKFLDKNGNIQTGSLSLSGNANPAHVLSGETFYSNSWSRQTGTMSNQPAISDLATAEFGDDGVMLYARFNIGAHLTPASSGYPEVKFSKDLVTGYVPGGNRGAWGTTINPGGSVTIPQGYHNGGGVVCPNMTLVNRAVDWGSGVRFSGDDTSASKACQFGIQYYAHSEYNVHIEFRIYRNGSRIDTVTINREGGLIYDPRGYIAKWYEGSGTYKYDVNVTYQAGNGTLHLGGMIVGY